MSKYQIILYYNYTKVKNPEEFKTQQKQLCEKLNLTGRIIIAEEGINGTLEGTVNNIKEYINDLLTRKNFSDTHIKYSEGTGNAFPKLSVKVRPEIVTAKLGDADINPKKITGKYISAEELHELFESGEEFYIVDMRNNYEHAVGHFENSVLPQFKNFRDLAKVINDLEHLRDKKIVTVCTGGVRCEKASGYLLSKGFSDVSQLYGGIVTYMEKYPNQNFLGELYVFDGRVIMGFNLNSKEHKLIGKCELCDTPSNNYINCADDACHRHFICCKECLNTQGDVILCSKQHSKISSK
ncbi:MAG: rhodanese-related sulfurtransferase [Patescibacteria group bacterium]